MASLLSVGEDPPNAFPVCLKQELFSGGTYCFPRSFMGFRIWGGVLEGLDYPRGSQFTFCLPHQTAVHC